MELEMDVAVVHHHHQQELSSQTLESMLMCTKPQEDKKPRPPEEALKCPRCDSGNTKFCYYNNYSLTQPRYFCKSCRRYWTKGGTLRNVPVGGGCRKNKRSSSSVSVSVPVSTPSVSASPSPSFVTSSNPSSSYVLSKIRGNQDHHIMQQHSLNLITQNSNNNHLLSGLPHLPFDSNCTDLSLAFARLQSHANGSMGYDHFDHNDDHQLGTRNGDPLGFLEAVRGGFLENMNSNMDNPFHHNVLYNGDDLIGNLMGLNNVSGSYDQEQQQILNPMFHDNQEQELSSCGAAKVKQEACNMIRPSEVGSWGFPWQMGAGGADPAGTMVHEVEPAGRPMIGGWNGIGSTNWHGLINSPLM
ncbi:hypothetical protein R6Q59_030920 [Mikania micrantha]